MRERTANFELEPFTNRIRRTGAPMAVTSDKRKQSLYFPEEMLRQIEEEATRQDRSLSWIVQQAWRAAREQIARMPGMDDLGVPRGRPT